MPNIPDSLVPFYKDGPDWPKTPEQQEAERAYRDAFLLSTKEASRWSKSGGSKAVYRSMGSLARAAAARAVWAKPRKESFEGPWLWKLTEEPLFEDDQSPPSL